MMTTLPDKKDAFMHKLMYELENFVFVICPPKLLYFKHTVLLCTLLVFGAN